MPALTSKSLLPSPRVYRDLANFKPSEQNKQQVLDAKKYFVFSMLGTFFGSKLGKILFEDADIFLKPLTQLDKAKKTDFQSVLKNGVETGSLFSICLINTLNHILAMFASWHIADHYYSRWESADKKARQDGKGFSPVVSA